MGISCWKKFLTIFLCVVGLLVFVLVIQTSVVLISSRFGIEYMKEMSSFSKDFTQVIMAGIVTIVTTIITSNKEAIKEIASKWIFKK